MLRRLLALVSAVVLVDVVFYSAIVPLLPAYTDDLGLSKSEAGALAGSYAAGTGLAAIPAGILASRLGPRRVLLLGLALLTVSCVAFGFADDYELLVAARFLQGIGGAGSWAAGMAWLLAVAPRERRGEMIGTALGVAIAGALGGPVIGALATEIGTEVVFSSIAVVAAALAFFVVVLDVPAEAEPTGGVLNALRARTVLAGAWLTTLPAVFFGTFTVLSALRLDELGVSATGVAAVFLVAAGVEAIVSPLVGKLSDRRGRIWPLRIGLTGILASCIVIPVAETASMPLAITVVVAAALAGMMWAPAMALLSDGAEEAGVAQGLAFGLVNLAWAGGQVLGSAGGSATADAKSDAVAFTILGVLAAISLAAMLRVRRAAMA